MSPPVTPTNAGPFPWNVTTPTAVAPGPYNGTPPLTTPIPGTDQTYQEEGPFLPGQALAAPINVLGYGNSFMFGDSASDAAHTFMGILGAQLPPGSTINHEGFEGQDTATLLSHLHLTCDPFFVPNAVNIFIFQETTNSARAGSKVLSLAAPMKTANGIQTQVAIGAKHRPVTE